MRMLSPRGKVLKDQQSYNPVFFHAYANEMQMCRGELSVERSRRVFTQGMSLRALDKNEATLVLKVLGRGLLLEDGHLWGQEVHFTNYLFIWRLHTDEGRKRAKC